MTIDELHDEIERLFPTAFWVHVMHSTVGAGAGTNRKSSWSVLVTGHDPVEAEIKASTPAEVIELSRAEAEKIYGPKPEHVGGCV